MSVKLESAGKACTDWDAKAYQQFSRLRQRPVNELLDRVELKQPKRIYDLGCGTGIATQRLAKRWPRAQLQGIDSSEQMLDEARCLPIKASWKHCDLLDWQPEQPADLLFAAAVLHFVSGHEQLLPRLLAQLNPGGCLAAHMPDWRDAQWYQLMLDTLEDAGPGGKPLGRGHGGAAAVVVGKLLSVALADYPDTGYLGDRTATGCRRQVADL